MRDLKNCRGCLHHYLPIIKYVCMPTSVCSMGIILMLYCSNLYYWLKKENFIVLLQHYLLTTFNTILCQWPISPDKQWTFYQTTQYFKDVVRKLLFNDYFLGFKYCGHGERMYKEFSVGFRSKDLFIPEKT